MYQSTRMIWLFFFFHREDSRLSYHQVMVTLLHSDAFFQMEKKETALPLLQESPGHSLAVADDCSQGGRSHEGEDPNRPWELAWLCPQLLRDLCKCPKTEQRESSHRDMEPGHAGEHPDPRSMETSSCKWPQKAGSGRVDHEEGALLPEEKHTSQQAGVSKSETSSRDKAAS